MGFRALLSHLPAHWSSFRLRRYGLDELPWLLRFSAGRGEVLQVALHFLFPVTSRVAAAYRRLWLRHTRLVAVVGTFGKTTTTHAILAALGQSVPFSASLNARGAIPMKLLHISPRERAAVVEIGISGPGQMAPLARIVRPSIVVATCIGSEHNSAFRTLERTREEKAEILRGLAPEALAVLNGDDPNVLWMASQTRARIVTFGFGAPADVHASEAKLEWPGGMKLRLRVAGQERVLTSRLLGRRMVYPLLAAVAVALELGCLLDDVLPRLAALAPADGRLSVTHLPNGAAVLSDDSKSGLETIHNALDVLAEIPAGRKIAVLGPITEPTAPQGVHYRALGARIAGIADLAVFVDSHREYKSGVRSGGMNPASVLDAGVGIQGAVAFLRSELRPGDVVLIKGRNVQKLERIGLALEGRPVRCLRSPCNLLTTRCNTCPLLEKGE